ARAATGTRPLSLHDALPISKFASPRATASPVGPPPAMTTGCTAASHPAFSVCGSAASWCVYSKYSPNVISTVTPKLEKQSHYFRSEEHTSELQSREKLVCRL